jgi:magnesium transporter
MKLISKKSIPPESLFYTGDVTSVTTIKHLQYNQNEVLEFGEKIDLKTDHVDWIIVEGLSTVDTVTSLCREFGVDNLVIEDILNVNQRNKIEVYDSYVFAVQKYTYIEDSTLKTDYISLLLFDDKLVTFSEKKNLFINTILERVKIESSLIRKFKHDYLFYVIYDIITDEVLHVFSYIADQVDKLEENLLELDRQDELKLYNLRKELVYIRNYSYQIQENLFDDKLLMKKIVDEKTSKYYEDLEDHVTNLNEKVKTELELLKGVFDIYMNNNSDKMNKIMKTLTIFSAIFIPLSFLSGIFGMNFVNFPILSNDKGLLLFIVISILIPVLMLIYFKKNKWF